MAIVSKVYCSSSQVVLVVRKRPHVVSGGGFVVTDCSQKVVFRVDGCGILGTKDELILRGSDGEELLLIRHKGGIVEALSIYRTWKGYAFNYTGSPKLVFSVKQPNSCLARNPNIAVRVPMEPVGGRNTDAHFEIFGSFPDRNCSILDPMGNVVAQIDVRREVAAMMASRDLYHVVVKPGVDQAFVFGVIATLDYIYGESTRC